MLSPDLELEHQVEKGPTMCERRQHNDWAVSYRGMLTGNTGNVTEFVGGVCGLRGLTSHLPHSVLSPSSFPTPVLQRVETALGHEGLLLSLLICNSPGYSASPAVHRTLLTLKNSKVTGEQNGGLLQLYFYHFPKCLEFPFQLINPYSFSRTQVPFLSCIPPAVLLCPNLYP